jgi:peptidoglycan hydrolase-like protein with peptidoglycan-binding domain
VPRTIARALALAALAAAAVPASSQAAAFGSRDLRRGAHGPDVKTMQRYLSHIGIHTSADGAFGAGTETSVRRFERRAEQHVDGVLRRGEARVLRRLARPTTPVPRYAGNGGAATAPPTPEPLPVPVPAPFPPAGARAVLASDGTATAPAGAPAAVLELIEAGNRIARKPYRYGGGHASFTDSGYDCSGSVSFALYGAALLSRPRDSSGLMTWGRRGRGRWISIYANAGHAYLTVAGLRFDTSGRARGGTRWHPEHRSSAGYVVRHPAGL